MARPARPKNNRDALRLDRAHGEERYRQLLDSLPHGIQECDISGVITFANAAQAQILGCTVDDLIGKAMWELCESPSEQQEMREHLETLVREEPPPTPLTLTHRTLDGQRIDVQMDWNYQRGDDGQLLGFVSVVTDITKRKRCEKELRDAKHFAESIVETAQAIILVLDPEGKIVRFNPYLEKLTGHALEEVKGKDCFDTFLPECDRDRTCNLFQSAIRDVQTGGHVNRILTKDGRERIIDWYNTTLKDRKGNIVGLLAVGQDITDRLRAEASLREREIWLESILSTLHECAVVVYDREGRVTALWGTPEQDKRYGMRAADAVGQLISDLLPPEQADALLEQLRHVIETGEKILIDIPVTMPRGEFWQTLSLAPLRDTDGGVTGAVGYYHDITERKRAEDSELRLRQLADSVEAVLWIASPDYSEIIYVSKAYESIWGRDCGSLHEDPQQWAETIHQDDRERVLAAVAADAEHGRFEEEYRVIRPDGSIRWVRDRAFPMRDEQNRLVSIAGIAEDITQSRLAESIVHSEQRYQAIVENQTEFIVRFLPDGIRTFVNDAYCRFCNQSRDELVGTSFLSAIAEEERSAIKAHLASLTPAEPTSTDEHRWILPSGKTCWTQWTNTAFFDDAGQAVEFQSIGRDVTRSKQAEDALRASEHRFRQIVESNMVGILFWDLDGRILDANRHFLDMIGYSNEDLKAGRIRWDELTPPEYHHLDMQAVQEGAETGACTPFEKVYVHKDGHPVPILIGGALLEKGNLQQGVSFVVDISDRKRAEAALKESQERLDLAVRGTSDGLWDWDIGTGEAYWSPQFKKLLGYEEQEIEATYVQFLKFVHPEEEPSVLEAVRRHLEENEPYDCEFRMKTKQGEYRWFQSRGDALRDESGEAYRMAGSIRDITDRKNTEHELRLSAEIMQNMAEGVMLARDSDGVMVFSNPRYDEIFGYEQGELMGKHVSILNADAEKNPEETAAEIMRDVEKSGVWNGEIHNIRKDGTPFWSRATISKFEHPQHGTVYLSLQDDISGRKRAERALAESEARLQKLVANLPGIVYRCENTPEWPVSFISQGTTAVTGYDPQEFLDHKIHWGEIVHRADREMVWQAVQAGVQQRRSYKITYRIVHRNGDIRWVWERGYGVYDETGRLKALEGFIRDITERRKAEEQSRAHLDALAHVGRISTMGEMAAGLAHELNQPLAAIATYSAAGQQILAGADHAEPQQLLELFELLIGQSMRAGEIIRRLRGLVAKRASVSSRVDVAHLLQEVLRLMASDLRQHEVHVEITENHSSCIVIIDDIQIQQVLVNLVRNALDAMSELEPDRRKLEIETTRTADNMIKIAVRDSGKGIPVEEKDRVFDAFFTTKSEGMGMGLAISRTIIESHNGRLWMTPNSDRGVTFHFTLPIPKKQSDSDRS